MLKTFTWPRYAHRRPAELDSHAVRRVPLVVVGAGPVGLCAAIDAAQRGQPVILLDEDNTVSVGSRGLCYAKRTLEIFDRLGVGQRVVDKGVTWNVGRTFHGSQEVFSFDLLPEAHHRRPGMVNLQQYHLEQMLVERAQQLPELDLRWQNKLLAVQPQADGALLDIETPDGRYTLHADWLVVADGARSPVRRQLGLDTSGRVFQDRFLIADVLLSEEPFARGATERRFWFDPPFHRHQSALLHREADRVWRMDFQLGPDADPEAEKQPERVGPRVRAALDSQGYAHIAFELEWVSVYTFQCRRMASFRHGRLLFVGDAAHQVSPFGARGANSGIQDTDNLIWKLDRVLRGQAPEALLDSYDIERGAAADENILNSTRSTDFMTPRSRASRLLRDAVLTLAAEHPFARTLVNSGRLSVPTTLSGSPLNTPDEDSFEGWMVPGAPADDGPLLVDPNAESGRVNYLLESLPGVFSLLVFVELTQGATWLQAHAQVIAELGQGPWAAALVVAVLNPELGRRYDARHGTVYLLRPDQHVAARWRHLDAAKVTTAVRRACGFAPA